MSLHIQGIWTGKSPRTIRKALAALQKRNESEVIEDLLREKQRAIPSNDNLMNEPDASRPWHHWEG